MIVRSIALSMLVLGAALTAHGDDSKKPDSLNGTWLPTAAEMGGEPMPDEMRQAIKLTIDGETYAVQLGEVVDRGTVKSDPAASPKTLDITGTEGPNKGKLIPAIYELNGDTLRVCYNIGGKDRPTEFKTTQGSTLFLVTYSRAKA